MNNNVFKSVRAFGKKDNIAGQTILHGTIENNHLTAKKEYLKRVDLRYCKTLNKTGNYVKTLN